MWWSSGGREVSIMGRPWPSGGCGAMRGRRKRMCLSLEGGI